MSTNRWLGGATAIAEVDTFSPAMVNVGVTYKITINGKIEQYVATAATAASVVDGLLAVLLASTVPEFADATWTAIEGSTAIVGTASTPGKPFTATASITQTVLPVVTGFGSALAGGGTLTAGTPYYYVITALSATAGQTTVSAETTKTPVAGISAPGAPIVTAVAGGTLEANSYYYSVSAINAYGETSAVESGIAGITTGLTSPFLDTPTLDSGGTLVSGTTYFYKLTTVNGSGETTGSNEVSLSVGGTNRKIVLTWTAIGSATGYKLYRGTAAGAENTLVTTIGSGATVTYTDTGSAGSAGTPPTSNTTGNCTLAVTWPQVAGATGYKVYRKDPGTGFYLDPSLVGTIGSGTTTVLIDDGIAPSAGTPPVADTTPARKITLTWTAVPNALVYKIYRSTTAGTYGATSLLTTTADGTTVTYTDTGSSLSSGTPPASNTATTASTFTRTATTVSSGPNDWNTAANWSLGTVPVSTEDVYVTNTDWAISWGLNQSSVVLSSLTADMSFTATNGIGLPEKSIGGYTEYRPTYLAIQASTVTIGGGTGSGAGSIKIDSGSATATTVIVLNTGSPAEQGLEAFVWKGTNSGNILDVSRGSVGVAVLPGETANLSGGLKIGYINNQLSDARVRCGAGVTIAAIVKSGGILEVNGAVTTLTQYAGDTTFRSGQIGTLTNQGGTVRHLGAGTIITTGCTLFPGAVLDLSLDLRAKTITPVVTFYAGAKLLGDRAYVTYTAGFSLPDADPGDGGLFLGKGRTLTVS